MRLCAHPIDSPWGNFAGKNSQARLCAPKRLRAAQTGIRKEAALASGLSNCELARGSGQGRLRDVREDDLAVLNVDLHGVSGGEAFFEEGL